MDDAKSPGLVAIRHQREKAISRLCEHFALDHIDAEELERLIDRAHSATTVAELEVLAQGLPSLPEGRLAEEPVGVAFEGRQTIVAIMGGAERKGAWLLGRQLRVVAIMGGAALDFRDARLPAGRTELEVVAIMGGVEIVVSSGLRIVSDGVGIMGGFEHTGEPGMGNLDADAPWLHVTGSP